MKIQTHLIQLILFLTHWMIIEHRFSMTAYMPDMFDSFAPINLYITYGKDGYRE